MDTRRAKAAPAPIVPSRRESLITAGLKEALKASSASPLVTKSTPTIAQRRSPQATLPKLVVNEGPSVANQPAAAPPTSPQRPSRSNPIAIPIRRRHENTSRPTTPLTAREEKGAYFSPLYETSPPKPQISASLRPGYKRPEERVPNLNLASWQKTYLPSTTLEQLKELSAFSNASLSMPLETNYRPSSPLAPVPAPISALSAGLRSQKANKHGEDLKLPSVPRYHPSNYQHLSSNATSTAQRSPALNRSPYTSAHHQRKASEARLKLKQYQREIITSATRGSNGFVAPDGEGTPRAPHIHPRGSPGPATPLMLEEQLDYMTAHMHKTSLGDGQSRELVDRMIREENERRVGLHSGSSSPAISPAGGPG